MSTPRDESEVAICQRLIQTIDELHVRGHTEQQIAKAGYHLFAGLVLTQAGPADWQSAMHVMNGQVLQSFQEAAKDQ